MLEVETLHERGFERGCPKDQPQRSHALPRRAETIRLPPAACCGGTPHTGAPGSMRVQSLEVEALHEPEHAWAANQLLMRFAVHVPNACANEWRLPMNRAAVGRLSVGASWCISMGIELAMIMRGFGFKRMSCDSINRALRRPQPAQPARWSGRSKARSCRCQGHRTLSPLQQTEARPPHVGLLFPQVAGRTRSHCR